MVSKKLFAIILLLLVPIFLFLGVALIVSGGQNEDSKSLTGPSKVVVNDQMKPTIGKDLVDVGQYLSGSGVDLVKQTPAQFVRGDVEADGDHDMFDGLRVLYWLGGAAAAPPCLEAADVDDDGDNDMFDGLRVLYWLGGSAAAPPPPCCNIPGSCGVDPTPDGLGCNSYPPCP